MEFYDTVRIFLNAQLNQVENREGNDDISHFLELFHFSLLIFFSIFLYTKKAIHIKAIEAEKGKIIFWHIKMIVKYYL